MVLITFTRCLFAVEAIFGKMRIPGIFCFIVQQKIIIKNQVLSIILSLSVKKITVNFK